MPLMWPVPHLTIPANQFTQKPYLASQETSLSSFSSLIYRSSLAGVMLTQHPCSMEVLTPSFWTIGRGFFPSSSPSPAQRTVSKACSSRKVTSASCVRANCCPMQIRGPALNGRYWKPPAPAPPRRASRSSPHRSGRNSDASGPYRSVRRCMLHCVILKHVS